MGKLGVWMAEGPVVMVLARWRGFLQLCARKKVEKERLD